MNELVFEIRQPETKSGKFITGKASVRTTKKGFAYIKRSVFEKTAREIFKKQTPENWVKTGAFRVEILCYFEIEKSSSKKQIAQKSGNYYIKKPDADNIAKGIQDGMTGVVFDDDNQISELVVKKYYNCFKDEQSSCVVKVVRLCDCD